MSSGIPPYSKSDDDMKLTSINAPSLGEGLKNSFQITALPGTDLWRKPPSHDVYNAPCYVAYFPVAKFHRARVTVTANWKRLYDQGGLVLFLPGWPSQSLWVKSGIEFVEGKAYVSTVAARDAADWSLLPAPEGHTKITLEIEREEINEVKGTGTSLHVYLIEGEKRTAIREVTWVFKEQADLTGLISVGIYAARPTKTDQNDQEGLLVDFEDLTIS